MIQYISQIVQMQADGSVSRQAHKHISSPVLCNTENFCKWLAMLNQLQILFIYLIRNPWIWVHSFYKIFLCITSCESKMDQCKLDGYTGSSTTNICTHVQVYGSNGLAAKRSAGVAPEVTLRNPHARKCSTLASKPRADATRSPKIGVFVTPQKGLLSS